MKKHIEIFASLACFMLMILFSTCQDNRQKAYLDKLHDITLLADTAPTLALDSLKVFNVTHKAPTEYAEMRYWLATIKLRDKCYLMPSSDDSIKRVYYFMSKHGYNNDKAEANYYMASTYRDLKDGPRSVDFFLRSLDLAFRPCKKDTMLIINTYSQLIYIYGKLFQYKEAKMLALREYEFARKARKLDSRIAMDVFTSSLEAKDTLTAIKFANIVERQIGKKKDYYNDADIISELLYDYTLLNKKTDAERCFNMVSTLKGDSLPLNYYLAMATYYTKYVSYDSASFYLNNYYDKSNSANSKYYATLLLLKYYNTKNDVNKSMYYAKLLAKYGESWSNDTENKLTLNSEGFYKYNKDKEREKLLKAKAMRAKVMLAVGFLVFVIIIICVIAIHFYKKGKMLSTQFSLQKDVETSKKLIQIKSRELETKRSELKEMESEISKLNLELEDSGLEVKRLKDQNQQIMKAAYMSRVEANIEDVIENFKMAGEGKYLLHASDWQTLYSTVNKLSPDFASDIQAKIHNINESTMKVCYLLKIGMSNPQIENILKVPRQTVWRWVKKIKDALGESLYDKL